MEQDAFKKVENLLLNEYEENERENYFSNKQNLTIVRASKENTGYNIKDNLLIYNDKLNYRDIFHMAMTSQEFYQKEIIKDAYYDHGVAYWINYRGKTVHIGYAATEAIADLLATRCGQKASYPFITYIIDILDYLYDITGMALDGDIFAFYIFHTQGKELINLLSMLDSYYDRKKKLEDYLLKKPGDIKASVAKIGKPDLTLDDTRLILPIVEYAISCFTLQADILYETIAMYYNKNNKDYIDKDVFITKLSNIYNLDDYKLFKNFAMIFKPELSNYINELIDLTSSNKNKDQVLSHKRNKNYK